MKNAMSKCSLFLSFVAEDKRMLVEVYLKVKRNVEEIALLKRDMESYPTYYKKRIGQLQARISEIEESLKDRCDNSAANYRCDQLVNMFIYCVLWDRVVLKC